MELLIIQISIYVTLVPILFGTIRYSQLSKNQKLLFWMIVLITINQLISEFLESFILELKNNLPFYRAYILIEFSFITTLFFRLIYSSRNFNLRNVLLILFAGYWVFDSFVFGTMLDYPELLRFTESVLIIFFGLFYFLTVFQRAKIVLLNKEFGFWFTCGILIYFTGNSLLFLFSEVVIQLNISSYKLIWTVHAFLTILLYIAYTIAIQCKTNHSLS